MPPIKTISPETPLAERFAAGLTYPLRGGALPVCVMLALGQCLTILPSFVGLGFGFALWLARWRYAATCLVHTANGFAEPPDIGVEESPGAGRWLTLVHMLVVALCVACALLYPSMLWPLLLFFALTLPAIDMSLAFDGDGGAALNPFKWQAVIGRLGASYFIPVVINVATGVLIMLPSLMRPGIGHALAQPLFAFGYTYLIIFNLHLMGVMIHRHHERFDMEPEAEALIRESGQDEDERLLVVVRETAAVDRRAAIGMLVERMQGRSAPTSLHQAYRQLLKQEGLNEGLIEHGQLWIAALMAHGEARRALALTQECVEIDGTFLPDSPEQAAILAELAASSGMTRLSLKLCRGFLARWPRSPECPRIGLLAAKQMTERHGQDAEAAVLLGKLAATWKEHPLHPTLVAQASQLQRAIGIPHTPAVD
ncbi:hypothetical protein [Dyella japonica]|uniref:Tetratricopeptide repeat protein n=1 Tax=Dyella japonica TaxID=231455 RepID=A0ABV2JQI3_9GAMM